MIQQVKLANVWKVYCECRALADDLPEIKTVMILAQTSEKAKEAFNVVAKEHNKPNLRGDKYPGVGQDVVDGLRGNQLESMDEEWCVVWTRKEGTGYDTQSFATKEEMIQELKDAEYGDLRDEEWEVLYVLHYGKAVDFAISIEVAVLIADEPDESEKNVGRTNEE